MEAFGGEVPEAEGPASLDSSRGKGLLLIVTCPRCFSFDDVRPPRRLPDGRLEYTCTGEHDDTGAYMWSTASSAVDAPAGRTTTGPKAAARQPVRRGPAWWPRTPQSTSCSNHFSPASTSVSHSSNTASSSTGFGCPGRTCSSRTFVNGATPCSAHGVDRHQRRLLDSSGCYRRLETTGQLVMVKGPGTGAWRHDQSIGYWARPPRPTGPLLTWSMFCATQGRTAEWTDEDRALPGSGPPRVPPSRGRPRPAQRR